MAGSPRIEHFKQKVFFPFLAGSTYLLLYLGLDHLSRFSEILPNVHGWSPATGLTFALLLAFGPAYAVFTLIAQVIADIWINPLSTGLGDILLFASCGALIYAAAAYLLGRFSTNAKNDLRSSRAFGRFLGAAVATAVLLSAVNSLNLLVSGLVGWQEVSRAILVGAIGAAAGILCVTPFLLMNVLPFSESLLHALGGQRALRSGFGQVLGSVRPQFLLIGGSLLLVLVLHSMLADLTVEDRFLIFTLICLPLIWLALAAGLESVSVAAFLLSFGGAGLLLYSGASSQQINESQTLILGASLIGMLLGSAVTESRLLARANAYRDAVLECVSVAVERLVGGDDWKKGFGEILRQLGDASQVSRIYLVENHSSQEGNTLEVTPYEWAAPELRIDGHQLQLLNFMRVHRLNKQIDELAAGKIIHDRREDLPEEDRIILAATGLRSSFAVPIHVEDRLWGALGLDRSNRQGDWTESEIRALQLAARGLGTVLAQAKSEEQFRELAGNIRAVFWTSEPDGQRRNYVSPAYEQVWGRSLKELREDPESWKSSIHTEDAADVESGLTKKSEFDLEYRLVLPDKSIRWIHDRGFPVRKDGGEITKVVGIAEDITAHKQAEEKIRGTTLLLTTLIDNLGSGILVEDDERRVRHVNQSFCKLFDVPAPRDSLLGSDSRLLVSKSKSFADRIEAIRKSRIVLTGEEMELGDLTLKRDYVPLSVNEQDQFHLWQYQNITESKRADRQIRASLAEKEVLLKEIHHRVKNNLQIICSLLSLQSNRIDDGQVLQIFADSQNRVKTMALVHERLYKSQDLGKVDFPGYTRNLTDHLLRSYRADPAAVQLAVDVESVPMSIDTAVPCGLIINELVSNSLKYAFPDERAGLISVRLVRETPSDVRLVVRDNGVGLPPDFDLSKAQSLGLKLVNGLTQQIGGSVLLKNQNGTEFDIRFPLNGQSTEQG